MIFLKYKLENWALFFGHPIRKLINKGVIYFIHQILWSIWVCFDFEVYSIRKFIFLHWFKILEWNRSVVTSIHSISIGSSRRHNEMEDWNFCDEYGAHVECCIMPICQSLHGQFLTLPLEQNLKSHLGWFYLHLSVFPFIYQLNSSIGVLVHSSLAND